GTSGGSMVVAEDATLSFGAAMNTPSAGDGTFTLTSTSTLSGQGNVAFVYGTTHVGGSIDLSYTSTIDIDMGATVSGSALMTGKLTNDGTLLVGGSNAIGTISVTGTYTQSWQAQLDIEL